MVFSLVGAPQTQLVPARLRDQQNLHSSCLRDCKLKHFTSQFVRKNNLPPACGCVGDGKPMVAGEYHNKDFEWDDLYEEVGPKLDDNSKVGKNGKNGKPDESIEENSNEETIHDPSSWEAFHSQHDKGHFFKERRYLTLEFPVLRAVDPPQHFIDIGSGCGSSILPVLRTNDTCSCTACDISPTALRLLHEGVKKSGDVDPARITTVMMDASQDPAKHPCILAGAQANCVLLVFTLSAVPPQLMHNVLMRAADSLQTGGLILFRDYGFCDMTQLRYKPQQRKGRCLYQRNDGTLAYYFTTNFLMGLMLKAGFKCIQCEYVCVIWRNRKKNRDLKRVFVHGVFQKV